MVMNKSKEVFLLSIIFLLIVSISNVQASCDTYFSDQSIEGYDPTCQGPTGCNELVGGVKIDGKCFDCGNNLDNICPDVVLGIEYYCDEKHYPDDDCDSSPYAYWSKYGPETISNLNVVVGKTSVFMVLKNSGLEDKTALNFEIYEDDPIWNDEIRTGANAIPGSVGADGKATATWTITQADLNEDPDGDYNKFYFKVNEETSERLALTILQCGGIYSCEDYTEQGQAICEEDVCGVAYASVEQVNEGNPDVDITCGDGFICGCKWENNKCNPSWEEIYTGVCGDGIINSGEQCDGDIDGKTCSNFDAFGGVGLECYSAGHEHECMFDVSGCTGGLGPGTCGNGVINTGEQCDGTNFGLTITDCSYFDEFTGSGLACYPESHEQECMFNTSGCIEPTRRESGLCIFLESGDDNCDDGFYNYIWDVKINWSGNPGELSEPLEPGFIQFNRSEEINDDELWHFDPTLVLYEGCIGGEKIIPCPPQTELSFFNFYNAIAVIIIVALIYFLLISKKKKVRIKRKNN